MPGKRDPAKREHSRTSGRSSITAVAWRSSASLPLAPIPLVLNTASWSSSTPRTRSSPQSWFLRTPCFTFPGRAEPVHGPQGDLEIIGMMRGGFPDIQWTLEETVIEGDVIAA